MTKQKHLKRRIRERMRATGESYITSRLHILAARPGSAPPRDPASTSVRDRAPAPARASAPVRDTPPAVASPAASRVPHLRLRSTQHRRTSAARQAPQGRYVAPAFTVLLTLLVGMIGLILVEGSDASPAQSLRTPIHSAPTIRMQGQ